MSCRDTLPLFFDNDRTDSGNDRERMVGCHSSRRRAEPRSVKDGNLGAPTRRRKRERSGCPSRHLKKSTRTASTPDTWNVSHRPVVTVYGLGVHRGTRNRACGLPLLQTNGSLIAPSY